MPTSADLLEVRELTVRYGGVEAVTCASLSVRAGEMVAVLGANGAGKTTTLRAISGLVPSAAGEILLDGHRINGRRPDQVTRAGIVHVPEGRHVVEPLTVQENLLLAGHAAHRRPKAQLSEGLAEVYALFPRLQERRSQASGLLSGGEQQMLAIGRGLMANPAVLLLDEPSMGLAPIMISEIYDVLRQRRGTLADTAILLAEQSTRTPLEIADRACILSRGQVTFFGPASSVTDKMTRAAYLGTGTRGIQGTAQPRSSGNQRER